MKPSLITLVRRALSGECALSAGTEVLVAVSGGPDSMALMSVLAKLGSSFGLSIRAHGVDHGLRSGAARELDVAERHATVLGIPFGRTAVKVGRGANLQARARELRWRALVDAATGATIATGHHADDRAETVLMRLLRGAGARGLAVLPPRASAPFASTVNVVRPLLRARRDDVVAHLERHGVPSTADPSNTDPRFLRTRVRQLLPRLAELDPNVVAHLTALADELGRAPSPLFSLPRATQEAIGGLVVTPSESARVWLPGGFVLRVERGARPKPKSVVLPRGKTRG